MALRFVIELPTVADVTREWTRNLSAGAAFVRGVAAEEARECVVVLVGPCGTSLELTAITVYAGDDGVGVQLDGWDGELRGRVERWVQTVAPPEAEAAADAAAEAEAEADAEAERDPIARNVFERLRNLSVVEQLEIARRGEVHERMALERIYGKTVWEAILRNPRVTPNEVAKIARKGALPRPLIELIVGNTAWLRSPEVRRALLANLRLAADQIPRILRLLPRHELRLVPNQTAYPQPVRDAARRLLRDA